MQGLHKNNRNKFYIVVAMSSSVSNPVDNNVRRVGWKTR